jgi:hypothetical protein
VSRALVQAAEKTAEGLRAAFERKVSESGAIAFRGGVARKDCPLARGSAARLYWLRGFDRARRADFRAAERAKS